MYIIIAHHNPAETTLLAKQLLELGCRISVTAHPQRLLSIAETDRPDLMLVGFPKLDDAVLLLMAKLRRHAATSGVPLVLINPATGVWANLHALEAGCDDFLITPFVDGDLETLVRRFST